MNDVVKECRICFDDEKNDEFIALGSMFRNK